MELNDHPDILGNITNDSCLAVFSLTVVSKEFIRDDNNNRSKGKVYMKEDGIKGFMYSNLSMKHGYRNTCLL